MIKQTDDIVELIVALHRKLLNINSDIRFLRKQKYHKSIDLIELIEKRKKIDSTLSLTKKLINHHTSDDDCYKLYAQYLNVYKST